MAKPKPVFELHNVSYSYNNQSALKRISFSISEGEKVAVVGANGSGKSTLLKLLDALLFPTSGTFMAFGQEISESEFSDREKSVAFRKKVGFVFQDPDVQLFSPTVWDEVLFAPLHLGLPKSEVSRRGEWALKTLGISYLKDRSPHLLSGGEQKKVALASVLSYQPQVWIFDEPTASLDPKSQSLLLDFIGDISRQGQTVITSTHDLPLISEIADKVYVLSESHELVWGGTPGAFLKNRSLLLKHNLIHEHTHMHHGKKHSHIHTHVVLHEH